MLKIGSVIDGKYKILNVIGKGGMSVVYLAMNEKANKQWAIKEIRKDGRQDYEIVKQNLIVETDLLKQLSHAHLPSIVDVIESQDTFLIVMDYIEGVPLSVRVKEEGAQPQEEVIEWAKQLCSVLGYLHTRKQPIIYRDLKPANVMLKPDGNVVLIDFGTARTFKETSVEDTQCLGTKGYAAPEQYGGMGQTDARTDIYCLGATLYHLITGHNPSEPPYEMYPIRQWNPMLSSGFEEIISKCVQANPEDRYQSCAELMYALEHYEELDYEYRKRQNKRFRLFLTSVAMAVICTVTATASYYAEEKTKVDHYAACLEEAAMEIEREAAVLKYEQAVNLNPSKGEAYRRLLDEIILEDDILSADEAYVIRDILNQNDGKGKTNEEYFKENQPEYELFAYQLGLAYFYSYEDKGNKSMSKKWLEIAGAAQTLETNQIERAKRLSRIADYYAKIGIESRAGDASISYLDYWNDLIALTEGNLVKKDNETTALITYMELVYQIYTNCNAFKAVEITESDMEEQLQNIENRLEKDFPSAEGGTERVRILRGKLKDNIRLARIAIETTFHTRVEEKQSESD